MDAAVKYIDDQGHMISEIIFLLREPYGVFIEFFPASGPVLVLCNDLDKFQMEDEVTFDLCGSPMIRPRGCFVDRKMASQVIGEFVDLNSGERPNGRWIEI